MRLTRTGETVHGREHFLEGARECVWGRIEDCAPLVWTGRIPIRGYGNGLSGPTGNGLGVRLWEESRSQPERVELDTVLAVGIAGPAASKAVVKLLVGGFSVFGTESVEVGSTEVRAVEVGIVEGEHVE